MRGLRHNMDAIENRVLGTIFKGKGGDRCDVEHRGGEFTARKGPRPGEVFSFHRNESWLDDPSSAMTRRHEQADARSPAIEKCHAHQCATIVGHMGGNNGRHWVRRGLRGVTHRFDIDMRRTA